MTKYKEFLVQRNAPLMIKTIYAVDVLGHNEYVSAILIDGKKIDPPLLLGEIAKRNNRGVTFETTVFNGRLIEIFLSNSDFQPCDESFVEMLFNQLKS